MADEHPALAEEQPFALEPGTAKASPETAAKPEPAPSAAKAGKAPDASAGAAVVPKAEKIAALIRNGLNDTAISRDAASARALETRLPDIVAAILKEV